MYQGITCCICIPIFFSSLESIQQLDELMSMLVTKDGFVWRPFICSEEKRGMLIVCNGFCMKMLQQSQTHTDHPGDTEIVRNCITARSIKYRETQAILIPGCEWFKFQTPLCWSFLCMSPDRHPPPQPHTPFHGSYNIWVTFQTYIVKSSNVDDTIYNIHLQKQPCIHAS